ncbi:hypothetical protein MRX96_027823 [Rhipicephalus microplus]
MLSVIWGYDAISSAFNTASDEDYSSLGGMSCQTEGPKKDFGDDFPSELCKDEPDLSPRTRDKFASAIVMQDTSVMEGEDAVVGSSRRLRMAVGWAVYGRARDVCLYLLPRRRPEPRLQRREKKLPLLLLRPCRAARKSELLLAPVHFLSSRVLASAFLLYTPGSCWC